MSQYIEDWVPDIRGAGLNTAENTTFGGTLNVTGKITGDDVDLASGAVVAGLGTGANGITLKNLKTQAASTLSGTELEVVIDIGGTPYYFKVYPTSS